MTFICVWGRNSLPHKVLKTILFYSSFCDNSNSTKTSTLFSTNMWSYTRLSNPGTSSPILTMSQTVHVRSDDARDINGQDWVLCGNSFPIRNMCTYAMDGVSPHKIWNGRHGLNLIVIPIMSLHVTLKSLVYVRSLILNRSQSLILSLPDRLCF